MSHMNDEENTTGVTVTVNVDKIVKYLCVASIMIVSIVFGCKYAPEILDKLSLKIFDKKD